MWSMRRSSWLPPCPFFFRFYAALEGFFTGLKLRARGVLLPTRWPTTTGDALHYCEISSTRANESILWEVHEKKTALEIGSKPDTATRQPLLPAISSPSYEQCSSKVKFVLYQSIACITARSSGEFEDSSRAQITQQLCDRNLVARRRSYLRHCLPGTRNFYDKAFPL
ncbi:hypothetical protein B0H14DRAFT_3015532, partial [Mycena olivaceomarginata]